jgi:transposase InsO family protein
MGMLPRFLKQGILGEAKRDDCAELDATAPEVLADLAMREDAASLLAAPAGHEVDDAEEGSEHDDLSQLGSVTGVPPDAALPVPDGTLARDASASSDRAIGSDQGLPEGDDQAEPVDDTRAAAPRLTPRRRRGITPKTDSAAPATLRGTRRGTFTPEQRVLLLDTWRRSGLPAGDFAPLVGVSKYTLHAWRKRFEEHGPAGLDDQPRGRQAKSSRLPELTQRAILMLKQSHPDWGCQRISDLLARGPALPASASAVARVLHEAGYEAVEQPTRPHPDHPRRFERARPNQLWQTDLFTFVLKRQNRRVYLVAFMDDHSRFIGSYGLHASQSGALVIEVLEAALANYGAPQEILTDNGAQYVTWRGKSQFSKQLEKRGIRQLVAKPRRPQTLGKIERFWGTLWRDFLETAIFTDLDDARRRIGLFLDHYNFLRPHQGVDGLVPADRFFQAAPEVLRTLRERVSSNALELARHGIPREPFYLTGQLDGQPFSVHRAGDRLILTREGEERREIELASSASPSDDAAAPDASAQPATTEPLPRPICPDGSPLAAPGEPGTLPPPAPGQSLLDTASLAEPLGDREANEAEADGTEGGDA